MSGGGYNLLYIKECEDFLADEELMQNLATVIIMYIFVSKIRIRCS